MGCCPGAIGRHSWISCLKLSRNQSLKPNPGPAAGTHPNATKTVHPTSIASSRRLPKRRLGRRAFEKRPPTPNRKGLRPVAPVDAGGFDIDSRPAIVYYFFVARGWGSPKPPDEG